jgi:altronate hydrolase
MNEMDAQARTSENVARAVRLHVNDNIVIARTPLKAGAALREEGVTAQGFVGAGHKIATRRIAVGEPIVKYDTVIGFASCEIAPGDPVGKENVGFRDFERDYAYSEGYVPVDLLPESERASFMGIVRPDGRVGTRNYVGIISTVNCSATVVHAIADWFTPERLDEYPNIDGVVALAHGIGCGMELTGEPMALLRRTMAGFIRHANLAAAIVVGLGCERNQISGLMQEQGLEVGPNLHTFTMQETGGTRKSIEAGIAAVKAMLPEANRVTRRRVSASHLSVGLQCGGSDSFSSITANPALGAAVDLLARHGGTGILSETPEIYGVEHTLTRRAASRAVGEKLIERIRWWKDDYNAGRDTQINGVVSPGNQAGGLVNIFEKSLGSAMKGGTGPLMAVYRYAEQVRESGLVFMDTPGYDPVSVTGQIAGGANLIAFTTGRGSMFGAKPVPSLKLATNTAMYRRLEEDMDINCGVVMDGERTIEEMGRDIFALMLETASGKQTKSELLGVGRHEFLPWQIGVVG